MKTFRLSSTRLGWLRTFGREVTTMVHRCLVLILVANSPRIDPPETHLHTPTNNARRTTETRARRGDLYSIFREPSPSRLPEQDTNPNKSQRNDSQRSPPAGPCQDPPHPMALGPPATRRTCGGAGERHKPWLFFGGGGRCMVPLLGSGCCSSMFACLRLDPSDLRYSSSAAVAVMALVLWGLSTMTF